jgi:hypothetical protein
MGDLSIRGGTVIDGPARPAGSGLVECVGAVLDGAGW